MATKGVQHEGGVSGVGAVAQTVGIKGINEAENRITDVNIKTLETVIALRRIRDAAVELQVDLKGVIRAMRYNVDVGRDAENWRTDLYYVNRLSRVKPAAEAALVADANSILDNLGPVQLDALEKLYPAATDLSHYMRLTDTLKAVQDGRNFSNYDQMHQAEGLLYDKEGERLLDKKPDASDYLFHNRGVVFDSSGTQDNMGKALELTEAGRKFLADAPAKQKELVTAFNIALTGFTSVLEMEGKGDKQTEDHAT